MRRILAAIMAIVMMIIAGGCAKTTAVAKSASNAKFERLMYFEKYRYIRAEQSFSVRTDTEINIEEIGTVLPEVDVRILNLFKEAKADIKTLFGSLDFFDWEQFENAELAQMEEKLLTYEGAEGGGSDAAYSPQHNVVIVFSALRDYPDDVAKATIAHELIHALTESLNTVDNPIIYEGLTEMLSYQLYGTVPRGYTNACTFVSIYMAALGAKEAIENILNGKFIEDVDSKTAPGAMATVSKSIYALDMAYYPTEEDYLIYVDLIVNYAISAGVINDIASQIKNIRWSDPETSDYFIWLIEEGGDNNTAA